MKAPRLKFSVRTLLVFMTLIAVWFAWMECTVRRQKETVAWVTGLGGRAVDYDVAASKPSGPRAPAWMRELFGDDYFRRITLVQISGQTLDDLSPLENFNALEHLTISDCEVADVEPLSRLKSLKELNVDGCNLSDLSPLANLRGLEKLSVKQNRISDLTPLAELHHLQELDASWNAISDVSPLSALVGMKRLVLTGNKISECSPLHGLNKLFALLLNENPITAPEFIELLDAMPNIYWPRDDVTSPLNVGKVNMRP